MAVAAGAAFRQSMLTGEDAAAQLGHFVIVSAHGWDDFENAQLFKQILDTTGDSRQAWLR